MEPELISKKELLDLTGISYGQLYRWKRKNLIPEDWFIRKSTFTGQETFFPKDKILARMQRIMSMKDDLSLDQIADQFSPNLSMTMSVKELLTRNIVSERTLNLFLTLFPSEHALSFDQILYVYTLDHLLRSGDIHVQEGTIALHCLAEHYPKFVGKSCDLFFIRKFGISTCALMSGAADVHFEAETKIVARLHVSLLIEELKIKLV